MKWTMTIAAAAVTTALFAGEAVTRGQKIAKDARVVPFAEVLEQPSRYTSTPVVTEGTVEAVCQNKGCWMQVTTAPGKPGLRVRFKDYGFFVPKESKGMTARLEGVVQLKTLSKADADHLEGEGVTFKRNPDGTATEASFVASGVELTPASCH